MNKKIYSFGMAAMMLLFSGNVMATDYYLSANGSDTNDGKTAQTALKTLSAVMAKVAQNKDGEHVYVSGIIKVNEEWTKAHLHHVIFEGTNPETDGFDAEGHNGIFHINNSICTFKNLSFKNGYKPSGEAGSGAIWGWPLKLTLENCVFEGNKVDHNNANQNAGAIFLSGTTPRNEVGGIYATNCKFINNTSNAGGGAIASGSNIVDLKNCYFQNNTATATGGAIYANTVNEISINACTFEGNVTTAQRGGAIFLLMGTLTGKTYTMANTTFYQNKAKGDGGAFAASDTGNNSDNTINFVHCTMSGNQTGGTVDGGGAINLKDKKGTVNVVNSIIQGNLSAVNTNSFADVAFGTTKTNFVNSYVGYVRKYADNESNYSVTAGKLNNLEGKNPSNTEIDLDAYDADAHIIRLKATSDAKTAADLSADAAYGVTTDQLGQAWTKPYIGAVQLLEGESTGISSIKTDAPKSIKGIYNIAGQYVGNDASQLAKGLYIINGKKVIVK